MVFARNLRSLLLQPPLRGKKVLAVDPGIRTGCKLAVLDETGKLLEDAVIYPHGQKQNAGRREAEARSNSSASTRSPSIAIGNGTGCRETEQLVADLIADLEHRRLNPTPSRAGRARPKPSPTPVAPAPAAPRPAARPPRRCCPTLAAARRRTQLVSTPTGCRRDARHHPLGRAIGRQRTTSDVADTRPPRSSDHRVRPVTPGDRRRSPRPAAGPPLPPPISLEGLPDAPADLAYVIVNEAGASDYSASPVAREEFPDLDATTRGTI